MEIVLNGKIDRIEKISVAKFNVQEINSIADKYGDKRQHSKGPTFALTYQGTWYTLVKNLGLSEEEAKLIESRYHELYSASDKWVQDKLQTVCKTGYAELAFGLRLRAPIMAKTLYASAHAPYEAQAESRTVGNALGQSYGLLNNRAAIEFRKRLMLSEFKYDIKPIAHIHDAQYYLIRRRADVVHWFNKNLTECMAWQELPEIKHNKVKLSGSVELFYPSWATSTKVDPSASVQDIEAILTSFKESDEIHK